MSAIGNEYFTARRSALSFVWGVADRLPGARRAQRSTHPLSHAGALAAPKAADLIHFRVWKKHLKTFTHSVRVASAAMQRYEPDGLLPAIPLVSMSWPERIGIDPRILAGKPVVAVCRISKIEKYWRPE